MGRGFGVTARPAERGNGAASTGGVESLARTGLSEVDSPSGQLSLAYVTAAVTSSVTKLMVASGSVAAAGVTLARLGLFTAAADGSVTLVARTAVQTGLGAATFTPYEYALATTGGYPASYTVTAGQRYAIGLLQVATTPMKVQGAYVLDPATPPVMARIVAAQTDIAASYAAGALSVHYMLAYLRARP